jgi:hypothetical protein
MKTILSESSNPDEWFHVIALIKAVRHAKLNTPCFCLITFRLDLNRPHQRTRPQQPRILHATMPCALNGYGKNKRGTKSDGQKER